MLNKAVSIAAKAHAGQFDKGGHPYILHPLRVMMSCGSETAKICAVLHDVVEDTDITLDDLRREGFGEEILAALDCLTRRAGERYDDFIGRVMLNQVACRVKMADLLDNSDLTRIPSPTGEDEARVKKYKAAMDRIDEVLPCADPIPECRLIAIDGIVEVHRHISPDQFVDMFLRFIASHGWLFGGGIDEVTEEEQGNAGGND